MPPPVAPNEPYGPPPCAVLPRVHAPFGTVHVWVGRYVVVALKVVLCAEVKLTRSAATKAWTVERRIAVESLRRAWRSQLQALDLLFHSRNGRLQREAMVW
jgi:hypothetical protein